MIDGKIAAIHSSQSRQTQWLTLSLHDCVLCNGPILGTPSTFHPFPLLSSAPPHHSPHQSLSSITLQLIYTKLKHAHVKTIVLFHIQSVPPFKISTQILSEWHLDPFLRRGLRKEEVCIQTDKRLGQTLGRMRCKQHGCIAEWSLRSGRAGKEAGRERRTGWGDGRKQEWMHGWRQEGHEPLWNLKYPTAFQESPEHRPSVRIAGDESCERDYGLRENQHIAIDLCSQFTKQTYQ